MRLRSHLSKHFFFVLVSIFPVVAFSQYYNLGQDPASLKWRQIVTPHLRLVYPENFERKALQMIPVASRLYTSVPKSLAYSPSRVPVIIHNYNVTPNAITIWAPKRIEAYTSPPQDMYAEDWMTQLLVHEYRHVVQMDRNNQGFTRILSWFLGEQAAVAINGLFVPSWFMEGDAVCTETALGPAGRGRIPNFEMLLRTQVMEQGAFTYDKAAFGSYKTFVPDQYELGYTLVANVRRKYGYQAWVSALDEVARKPFVLTPFNRGLKKATGFGKEDLFSNTMREMDSLWKWQDKQNSITACTKVSPANTSKYENYKFPVYVSDSIVVSSFSSIDDITRFVITGPAGFKEIIATPGYLSAENISAVSVDSKMPAAKKTDINTRVPGFLLAWTETINDIRWEQRNYSVIRIFDSNTGLIKKLALKSRLFAPALSPDGHFLAAARTLPEGNSSLVIINIETGEENVLLDSPDTGFYMSPSWSKDGENIVFTYFDGKGKSLAVYDLVHQRVATLLPSTTTEISNPVFAGDYVLFNGSFSGIENIYALKPGASDVYKVTSARYGARDANLSPDGKRIVYSDYSSNGYSLAETSFNPEAWAKLNEIVDFSPSLYKYLVKEELSLSDTTPLSDLVFQSEPYRKAAHLINFHSWAPAYINYMEAENGVGVSFMSQNELSTATAVVGYKYDMAEKAGKVTADFSWQGWFPIIDLGTSYGKRTAYTSGENSVLYSFNETVLKGGVTVPLLFTGGKYYKGLQMKLHTSFTDITNNTSPEDDKLDGTFFSFDYGLYAYRFIKQSNKDLFPRWGQSVSWGFRHTPFGDNDLGNIMWISGRFYFPGIVNHHGIRADVNWQQRNGGDKYYFASGINYPRGYVTQNDETVQYIAMNYKFPFAYPDFSFGPLVYVKRLKANIFYDRGEAITHGDIRRLESVGVELSSDIHVLRFIFPIDLGLRVGYLPAEKQYFTDLLFSVNLSN